VLFQVFAHGIGESGDELDTDGFVHARAAIVVIIVVIMAYKSFTNFWTKLAEEGATMFSQEVSS